MRLEYHFQILFVWAFFFFFGGGEEVEGAPAGYHLGLVVRLSTLYLQFNHYRNSFLGCAWERLLLAVLPHGVLPLKSITMGSTFAARMSTVGSPPGPRRQSSRVVD